MRPRNTIPSAVKPSATAKRIALPKDPPPSPVVVSKMLLSARRVHIAGGRSFSVTTSLGASKNRFARRGWSRNDVTSGISPLATLIALRLAIPWHLPLRARRRGRNPMTVEAELEALALAVEAVDEEVDLAAGATDADLQAR